MGDRETRRNDRRSGDSHWSRVAYASAVAVLVVGTFASFGGISYAASGSSRVARTVERVATGKHVAVTSSASNQYHHKVSTSKAQIKAVVKNRKPSTPVAIGTPTGTLPFTGLSLLGTLLLGCALIVTGTLLRLRERRSRG